MARCCCPMDAMPFHGRTTTPCTSGKVFEGHGGEVHGALILPDGRRVLSWSADNILRLWDLVDQRELKRYVGDHPISTVKFSPEYRLLLVGDIRGHVFFFELPD
jgi:WD40 repeat protein